MSSYGVYSGTIPLNLGDYILEASQDNITAYPGGAQSNATQLFGQTSRITTVATSGDSVVLPPSQAGLELLVINHGANPMQVFGYGTDTIDDIANATGVNQMANSFVLYSCATKGAWYTEGIANGFARGYSLQTFSSATVAANVGGTQGTGTALTAMLNNITAAGASYSVTLPPSSVGMDLTVHNISSQTVLVFPNAGGTTTEKINALSANGSYSMATNTSTTFTCAVAGQWYTVPRVAS